MKKCILMITTKDGQNGYATTDYLATITRNKERAKIFTLKKALKLLEKPQAKGFKIVEL